MQKNFLSILFQDSASDVIITRYFKSVYKHTVTFLSPLPNLSSLCFIDICDYGMDLNFFPFFLLQFISFYLLTDSLWQLLNKFYLLVSREEN